MAPLATVIAFQGKSSDGGNSEMAGKSMQGLSAHVANNFGDPRTNILYPKEEADLTRAVSFAVTTAALRTADVTPIAFVYAGDFVVSKGKHCVVTCAGEKLDVINMFVDAIAALAGPPPKIELQLFIDSACPILAGTKSKKRFIKADAMQEAVDGAADVFDGLMVMWPAPTLPVDVSLWSSADDSSDSDGGSSHSSEAESDSEIGMPPVAQAIATVLATARGQELPASDLRRIGSALLGAKHATLECVASKNWACNWLGAASGRATREPTSCAARSSMSTDAAAAPKIDLSPPLVDAETQVEPSVAAAEPKPAAPAVLRVDAKEFTPPPSEFATHSSATSHYQATASTSTLASSHTVPQPAGQQVPQRPGAAEEWAARGDPRRGIYYCDICQCDVFGDHNWALHLASEKHKRREILTNPDMAGRLDATQTAMLVNPKNFYKCDVCNVVISGQANILQHVNGSQHKKNAARKGIILPDPAVEASGGGTAPPPPPPPPGYVPLAPSTHDPVHVPSQQASDSRAECRICGEHFDCEEKLIDHYDAGHPPGSSGLEKSDRGSESSARIQGSRQAFWEDSAF